MDPLDEAEEAHVRAAGRPVDGEVPEDGDVEAIEMVIGEAHGLRPLLGGGVGRQGPVGVGVLREGDGVVRRHRGSR